MTISEFIEELKKLNIEPTEEQLNQLNKYYELIVEYNKVMNLTGITEKNQVYLKHFYDSLTIAKVIDLKQEETLCDIGTGAGFPGIVLKILFPNLKITLIDSLNKRIEFLMEYAETHNCTLYQTLKDRYATNYIIQEIDSKILNNEYKTTDEAKEYADNQLKIYKMMYNNSDSELLSAIQDAGYSTLDEFKEAVILSYKRKQATRDYEKAYVPEDKIKKYYDENVYGDITISHILVKLDITDTMTDEEKQEASKKVDDKIKEIYEKLDGGQSFSEVAKEYSEDNATKKDGGKIGTFSKQEMIDKFNEEFEEAATNL